MSDPFTTDAARRRAKAEKDAHDARDPNRPDRIQARIAARKSQQEAATRPDPRHPWPKKFYEP